MKRLINKSVAVLLSVALLLPSMSFMAVATDDPSDILINENFDDPSILNGLPSGWVLDNDSFIDTAKGGYMKVVEGTENPADQVLDLNLLTNTGRKTVGVKGALTETYQGDFTATFDMAITGASGNRFVSFLSGTGQSLFAVGANNLGKFRIKTYNDATFQEYDTTVVPGQKYAIKVVYEHEKEVVHLFLDGEKEGTFDMSRSSISKSSRNVATISASHYFSGAISSVGNSLKVDNVLVKKYSNQAPVLEKAMENQYIAKDKTLSIDLSQVFSEPEGDKLTYTCENGEIVDGIYQFTPNKYDTYHEKITAKDSLDGEASAEFDIESVIYTDDFESYDPAEKTLPPGYTTNNAAGNDNYKAYVDNIPKSGNANNALGNNLTFKSGGSTSIYVTNGLEGKEYDGKISYQTKIYTNSKTERALIFANNASTSPGNDNRILAIHFARVDDTKSKVNIRFPNAQEPSPSNGIDMPNVFVPTDTWTDVSVTMETDKGTASIKIGDYDAVPYNIKPKAGFSNTIKGIPVYNYIKNIAANYDLNSYLYQDDIVFKKINRAPEVITPLSAQAAIAGTELTLDISSVFKDWDGDLTEITAKHGTVTGTSYTYTPLTSGTVTETLTAVDSYGETVTSDFTINVADPASAMLYQTDFETDTVGQLPQGYSNGSGDISHTSGVTDDLGDGGKYLKSQVDGTAAKANGTITYGFKDEDGNEAKYTGLLQFETKVYNKVDQYEKQIRLLSELPDDNTGTKRTMAIILNNTDPATTNMANQRVAIRIDNANGGSKTYPLDGITVAADTWTTIKAVIDTDNQMGYVTIGDFAPVEIPMELNGTTNLTLGGFAVYNNARKDWGGTPSYLYLDDISLKEVVGNNAPVASGTIAPQEVKVGDTLTVDISGVFTDQDNDKLGIASDKGIIADGKLSYAPAASGPDDITLTAVDGKGGRVQYVISLNVLGNAAPKIEIPVTDQYIVLGETVTLQLNDTFSDKDGKAPVVITADKGELEGTKFTYTPDVVGEDIVSITATDDEGAATVMKFRVITNDTSGKDTILFKEDFSITSPGAIPAGWRKDFVAGEGANSFYGVAEDTANPGNQYLHFDGIMGKGSNAMIAPMGMNYSGDFTASFDLKYVTPPNQPTIDTDVPGKTISFANSDNKIVFSISIDYITASPTSGPARLVFRIKGQDDSVVKELTDRKPQSGQQYHFEVKYSKDKHRVQWYINGEPAAEFDTNLSTSTKNFSYIRVSSYYRRAYTTDNAEFYVDNMLMKADVDIAEDDRTAVEKDYEDFRWEYLTREPSTAVTKPLNLRTEGRYGSTISWECSNPKVVFSNGYVERQTDGDKLVTLKATISQGSAKMSKSFDMIVKQAIPNQYIKEFNKVDFEGQTIGAMPAGWTAPSDYPLHEQTKITVQKDPLNTSNQVLQQFNHHYSPQEYSGFTGRYALPQKYTGHVVLNVDYMVKQLDTQVMLRIYNDKSELLFSVGNQGSFQYAAADGTNAIAGIPIQANKWYNFRIEMFTDTGYVLWYIDDQLAACFRSSTNLADNYSLKWIYLYNWVKDGSKDGVAYLDNITVKENMTSKMFKALEMISFDSLKNGARDNFNLPVDLIEGVNITWASNDTSLITVNGNEAAINRPAIDETDKSATLTATAEIDGKTLTKDFSILVKKHVTAQEAVDSAFEELAFSDISNEPEDAVTKNLSLITKGYENTDITWESQNPSVLRIDGNTGVITVTGTNGTAKLIATISQDGITRTKEFNVTVLKYFGVDLLTGAALLKTTSDIEATPALNLVDGNFGGLFSTLYEDNAPSVTFDLGAKQRIDSGLVSANQNVKSLKISVSNDNLNFKQIYSDHNISNSSGTTLIKEFNFSAVDARYVRFDFEPQGVGSVSVREIQLFNSQLTTQDALRLAKDLLKIPGSDRIQADIKLPVTATHDTTVSWESSNTAIVANDGKVIRPAQTTDVILTATLSKDGQSVTKDIKVTVLASGTVMGKDPNKMEKYYGNPTSMTDEMFFGKWEEEYNDWDFDYMPKINYDYCDELRRVGEYAKAGDYSSAKSELVSYYKTKDLNYHINHSSREYDKAELYANNILYSSNNSLIGTVTVPSEYEKLSIDVSSYIKNRGNKTMYFTQKYKNEPQAEFYTKEAENGAHTPELVIMANGKEMRYKAVKDTYVSPDIYQETNFGAEPRMYVKETKADDPSTVKGGFGELWTKDTKRAYLQFNITGIDKDTKIDSAFLEVYGKADGAKSDIIVWGEGNTSWLETPQPGKDNGFDWTEALVSVFSWNGSDKVDWNMPTSPADGADNATYMNIARAIWLSTLTGCYNTDGDEYYAYHAIRQSMDLFEGTKDSVAAYNLQDAGIRAGTMVAAFNSLRESEYMTDDACMAFIKNMWQLNKTLTFEGFFAPAHNHGVYSNRGQTRITLYFPEFADYKKYKNLFISRWDTLSGNLVKSDGSYIEASFNYTNEVINNFLTIIEESKSFNFPLNDAFNNQLIAVTRYLADCLQPDLTAPAYGDSDLTNYNTVLRKVANYFDLKDVKYILSNGGDGEKPDHTSVYYGGNGATNLYLNLRDDWSKQGMMMATNFGFGDGKSHTHPDNMAVTMFAYGKSLLVDNGRYNYSQGGIADWLRRTTEAHNVVNINNTPQGNRNDKLEQFYTNDGFDYAKGLGTSTVDVSGKPFDYYRTILFPKSKFFIINDNITPPETKTDSAQYDQNWHFLPGSNWTYDKNTAMLETHFDEGANLIISQVDKTGFEMVKQDGYYSGKQGESETTKFPSFRQNKTGKVTYDTILYPKPAGDTSTVETRRIALVVNPDTATAFNIDIVDGTEVQKNVFYQSYESALQSRKIGDYQFDGQAMLIELGNSDKLSAVSLVKGNKLTVTKNGQETTLVDYQPKETATLTDLYIKYNYDTVELESSSLTLENITGLTINAGSAFNKVTLNGNQVSFVREGDLLKINVKQEIGADKVVVSEVDGKFVGTTSAAFTTQASYAYGKNYQAALTVGAQSKISSDSNWDGSLPKVKVSNTSPRNVSDGDSKAYLSFDRTNTSSEKPYELRIEKPSDLSYVVYQNGKLISNFKHLSSSGIDAANSALSGNEVGLYTSSGAITLYSRLPIDVTLYTKKSSPPSNNGGGGGPVTPPTTEPTTPPTTEPTTPPTTDPTNPPAGVGFADIKGHWAEGAINEMNKIGVVNGVSETEFSPDTDVTRAEFAAMITRLLGLQAADGNFADVASDAWYYGSVGAVAANNIMIGADGYFRPDDQITREEMTKVLVEAYAQKKGAVSVTEEELSKFTDKDSVSDWATLYMAGAVKLGLISGMTATTIAPQENATRAQAAMMFKRLYDLIRF